MWRPRVLSSEERSRIDTLGPNLATVWTAATTTPRDRKELLGTLIEEVIVKVERDTSAADLTVSSSVRTVAWRLRGRAKSISVSAPPFQRHGRARAPTGRALSRHRDRRHPQQTGA